MPMYGNLIAKAFNKEVSITNNCTNVYVMLTTASYTPDADTHIYKNQVTNEISGTNYAAKSVGTCTFTYNATNNTWTLDAPDTVWSTATIANARYAVLYDNTPSTDATKPLICYVDLGAGGVSSTAADFTIQWNASGIGTFAAA